MPMFREEGLGQNATASENSAPITIQPPPAAGRWLSRKLSEESIRTELCEGPIPDSPCRPATPEQTVSHGVSDRAELIERLKRGESPSWIPSRHLESLFHHNKASSPPRTPQLRGSTPPGLLPAATITPDKQGIETADTADTPLSEGLSIERPRSALHSGNFTPEEQSPDAGRPNHEKSLTRSDSTAWIATSPRRDSAPFNVVLGAPDYRREAFTSPGPSCLSSSLSSSFVYKPPTSPLVQSESNDEIDVTLPLDSRRNLRRHTLNFSHSHSPFANAAGYRQTTPIRREGALPYQAHQPQRSLNTTPDFWFGSSPQTPGASSRSRRPSFSSEASPLQHASMVGSYEESILRGRMSTTPSKPLEFLAQIGVLGLGKCKPTLRCPAHVTLPFSAVFYSYPSTSHGTSKVEDGPSPYVGQIDLENGLANPDESLRARRKLQARYQDRRGLAEEDPSVHDSPPDISEGDPANPRSPKPKRRSRSPKAPPGGHYRIPEKGQLQIIIKNQNKTAVKLFLVPYDLAGMEPGTKTFIRQRSYSAGPIIETDMPSDAARSRAGATAAAADRPILRYLIHLHICCPSKGRYYLYKSIRVVFANRVPDGKERLRNEVTYPEPRFAPYKPTRTMPPAMTLQHPFRHGPTAAGARPAAAAAAATTGTTTTNTNREADPNDDAEPTTMRMPRLEMTGLSSSSSSSSTTGATNAGAGGASAGAASAGVGSYDKLSRGDVGYGGNASGGAPASPAEGLLSKRLRSLGVHSSQQQQQQQQQQQMEVDGSDVAGG
ncbi:hypothetical protein VTK56DRAFT_2740 [Thermocarpiscus australiensis]